MIRSALLFLLLAADGGEPTRVVETTRVVDCRYAGFCCQFDWIGESGCRFRLLCKGKQIERLRDGVVVERGPCQ